MITEAKLSSEDELRALGLRLLQIAEGRSGNGLPHDSGHGPSPKARFTQGHLRDIAIAFFKRRQNRSRYFDADLFGEVVWDMLLHLYIVSVEGKAEPTTSLCIACNTPVTTCLRYINLMEQRGLVARSGARHDGRVTYVALTDKAREAMERYLTNETPGIGGPGGFMLSS